jgi:hypothetical protein
MKPEDRRMLLEIAKPELPPVARAGGEALLRLADYLEQLLCDQNKEVAPAAKGHVCNAEAGAKAAVA